MNATDILTQRLDVSEQASNCRVGDETVILHAGNGTYYGLDPIGSRIWQMLQEGQSSMQACARIAEEFAVPLEQVEADARVFLGELARHDIIRCSPEPGLMT